MGFSTMSGIPKVTSTANFYSNTNPLLQSRGIGGFAEPSALFGAGEQGAWWDFSDLTVMFQDSAGTVPAALESPVGKVLDKSGKNNHLIQATAGARPILSRRYNRLQKTEQFSNGIWTKRGTGSSVPSTMIGPNGAPVELITVDVAGVNDVFQVANYGTPGAVITNRIWIKKAVPGGAGVLRLQNTSDSTKGSWSIDFSKLSDGFELINASHPAVNIVVPFTGDVSGNAGLWFNALSGGPLSFYATQADQRLTADATLAMPEYQKVDTSTSYDTLGFPAYLLFDGATKWMQSASAIPFSGQQVTSIVGSSALAFSATGTLYVNGATTSTVGGFGLHRTGAAVTQPFIEGTAAVEWLDVAVPITPTTQVESVAQDLSAGTVATRTLYYRNNVQLTGTPGGGTSAGVLTSQTVYVGSLAGTDFFNGRMYGLVLRNAATNANDFDMTNKWMGSKCGLFF